VIGPVLDLRKGAEIVFRPPDNCPSCRQTVENLPGEVAYYCVNGACPAQLVRNLEHFASRGAMDIVGMGIKIVEQLVGAGLVMDVADIYKISREDLLKLEGFADKKADNLIEAINISKERNLTRLIIALGIRGVGEILASDLANHFKDLGALANATEDDLQKLEGVGPNIALSIRDWFSRSSNRRLLDKFREMGVWPIGEDNDYVRTTRQTLNGLTFVITGAIPGMTREELKNKIEEHGGKVTDSISKNTSYLIVGEQPGSKLEKGKKLGIEILDFNGFRAILGEE
jgi:DNA ligase (NAD+)